MKIVINLTLSLIILVGMNQSIFSQQSDSFQTKTISLDTSKYFVGKKLTISPAYKFNLSLDKEKYNIGEVIRISFRIDIPPVLDASFATKIIFPNEEKLGIEIFKDSLLIYKYPSRINNIPDTLFFPTALSYNWNQIDNHSVQVGVGEYTIRDYLLHDVYSKFVQQKKFLLLNNLLSKSVSI